MKTKEEEFLSEEPQCVSKMIAGQQVLNIPAQVSFLFFLSSFSSLPSLIFFQRFWFLCSFCFPFTLMSDHRTVLFHETKQLQGEIESELPRTPTTPITPRSKSIPIKGKQEGAAATKTTTTTEEEEVTPLKTDLDVEERRFLAVQSCPEKSSDSWLLKQVERVSSFSLFFFCFLSSLSAIFGL